MIKQNHLSFLNGSASGENIIIESEKSQQGDNCLMNVYLSILKNHLNKQSFLCPFYQQAKRKTNHVFAGNWVASLFLIAMPKEAPRCKIASPG